MRQEEEALTAAILADQPTDIQLLTAKEQVNLARRKILKSEAKRDAAQVEANTGAEELRASRTAHDLAESRLDKMQATFKDLAVSPKEEPGITEEEQDLLKKSESSGQPLPGTMEVWNTRRQSRTSSRRKARIKKERRHPRPAHLPQVRTHGHQGPHRKEEPREEWRPRATGRACGRGAPQGRRKFLLQPGEARRTARPPKREERS